LGRLERKLDTDLIERIEANGPQTKPKRSRTATAGKRKSPRNSASYRGAARNTETRKDYLNRRLHSRGGGFTGSISPNVSRRVLGLRAAKAREAANVVGVEPVRGSSEGAASED
jgi:hypothetical protein